MSHTRDCFQPLRIVIPAYNAERTVARTLDDVFGWLDEAGFTAETASVIVVDDGSSDATSGAARNYGRGVAVLRNEPNRGKGWSVRRGVLAVLGLTGEEHGASESAGEASESRGGWVLFMDVDNSTPIRHLDRFAAFADRGEVLIASRRSEGSRIVKRQHRIRQVLGRTFPRVVRLIALPSLTDTQCGFKVFTAAAARRIFPAQRIERFAFDVELLMLAERLGYRIVEIPADWENPPESTLKVARDAPKMLFDVVLAVWRLRSWGSVMRRLRRQTGADGPPKELA